MSYEGRSEFLCKNGHYSVVDCYDDDLTVCICGEPIVYRHSIDDTNGEEIDNPSTFPAEKRCIGFDDVWHEDHYGNRFATKRWKFEPEDSVWSAVTSA